jgi:hypothetical protein
MILNQILQFVVIRNFNKKKHWQDFSFTFIKQQNNKVQNNKNNCDYLILKLYNKNVIKRTIIC